MSVDQIDVRRPVGADATDAAGTDKRGVDSPVLTGLLNSAKDDAGRCMAVAPLTLDVMGGIAEYSGGLVLGKPLAEHAVVVVQRRQDDRLCVGFAAQDGQDTFGLPVSLMFPDGRAIDASTARAAISDLRCLATRCVLGTLVEGVRRGFLPAFPRGLSFTLIRSFASKDDACALYAWSVASLTAAAAALGVSLQARNAGEVFRHVSIDWVDRPPNVADAVFSTIAPAEAVTQLRCDTLEHSGTLAVPEGVELAAIDCGFERDDSIERYSSVRTASFMGRLLIEKILRHGGKSHIPWDGYLSRVSVNDYVELFRDRLPTKITGREFLERFGETGDPLTRIDPAATYRVRSRTEHHVYEHARACQFVDFLARAGRSRDDRALQQAGELMWASHWSYGQRCGLGSVETDLLGQLLRRHAESAGLYGVRLTGRGCGGMLAALAKSTDRAFAAIDAALQDYRAQTGRQARVLRGSLSGALLSATKTG